MSVSEDSVSCPIENSVTVHLETVQNSTNVHSCDVEEGECGTVISQTSVC